MLFSKLIQFDYEVTPFSSSKWDVTSRESSRIKRSLTSKAKASFLAAFVLVSIVIVVLVVYFLLPRGEEGFWPSYVSESALGQYQEAAISTDAAPCAHIGRDIFERNGSAIDAAIAILVCMGAHNPHSMGLGGGFLMLYYDRKNQEAHYLDAREVAPMKADRNLFDGNATKAEEGGLSIAVPGELPGYVVAHEKFGKLPWRELFNYTIEMCKEGIEVSPHLARGIARNREKLLRYGAIGEVFLKNGTVYEAGERLKMPRLAQTLEIIAEQGLEALYGSNNELAKSFLKDMQDAGSIIEKADMVGYTPKWREPVKIKLRKNTTLYGVSPPGSGPLLTFMMAVLDGYTDMDESVVSDKEKAALAYHRMAETFKYAYAYRSLLEDNEESKEQQELVEKLMSKEHAETVRKKIDDSKTFNELEHYGVKWYYVEDHGTAHLSLVSPNGDAVSVTSTVNQYFGSKILSPSTGIVLNDEMDDFSSPNITNMFDLPPTPMNEIKGGRRPMSSMAPTILVDADGNVTLVLGGNGGTMITSSVLQVAARNLFFGENIKQCIDAPRVHHQLTPNVIHYEKDFPQPMVKELRKFGHKVEEWNMGMMSIIMGVQRGEDGQLYANSDYRKGGGVDGF